ncbi:transposase [Streptomyces mirabilis]|uniref:transposase n=1 Tax=Streptomyces mirabilis TaxID=68239 RepID=UPI00364B5BA9
MGSKQQKCDAEFREGAVRIVIETGKPIPEVAEDLGVHPGTLQPAFGLHPTATEEGQAAAAAFMRFTVSSVVHTALAMNR